MIEKINFTATEVNIMHISRKINEVIDELNALRKDFNALYVVVGVQTNAINDLYERLVIHLRGEDKK